MAKTKKKGPSDKRITISQHIDELHKSYDDLELMAIRTAERTLRETFGFGDVRMERFREAYLMNYGEEAAKYAEEIREKLRKGIIK